MSDVTPGGMYEHYKGKRYRVIAIATHSETLERLVVYETLYDNLVSRTWVRPLEMFVGTVATPSGTVPRFRRV